jgi:hypothetical protein
MRWNAVIREVLALVRGELIRVALPPKRSSPPVCQLYLATGFNCSR